MPRPARPQFSLILQPPWSDVGRAVRRPESIGDVLAQTGLDWSVAKIPLIARVGETVIPSENSLLIRSTDNCVLGEVPNDWVPAQNKVAFELFASILDDLKMRITTAGAVKDGRIVWAIADARKNFSVGNDRVTGHVLLTLSHEMQVATNMRLLLIREASQTSMLGRLSSVNAPRQKTRLTHMRDLSREQFVIDLKTVRDKIGSIEKHAMWLSDKRYNSSSLEDYLKAVLPVLHRSECLPKKNMSRAARDVLELIDRYPGSDLAPGSWWQALHAVIYHIDHLHGHFQHGNAEFRLMNAWWGAGARTKEMALELVAKFASR